MRLIFKAFVAALSVFALLHAPPRAHAQAEDAAAEEQTPRARKIDEFGRAAGCDHGARLDNFAIELQNQPDAVGYVIAYGPRGEGGGTAAGRLSLTKTYLVETRGLDAERIKTVNGGRYKTKDESFGEFWIVPPGADAPEPAAYQNDADSFTGKFSDQPGWDSFEWGEGTGPSVGGATLAGLADVLRSQPGVIAYVVAYQADDDAPGAWRRVAGREAEQLKSFGIAAGRVRVVFGGYGEELRVHLWVMPKDAPPPVEDAGAERKPKAAAQVARMGFYQLKYEDEARAIFKGFAEVLKADKTLTAHLVFRLSAPRQEDGEGEGEAPPPDPEEPPDVDPAKLAEKWKADLLREYGIGEHRLVVHFVPPGEESGLGDFEAWVVPPGAAPPDPYAVEDTEEEEAEAEAEEPKEGEKAEEPEAAASGEPEGV